MMHAFRRSQTLVSSFVLFTAAIAVAAPSEAARVAALQDGRSIAIIDTAKKTVVSTVAVDGGAMLIGVDVRPSDGKLYGVTPDGVVVVIDPVTGKWQKKSQLSEKLPVDAKFTVDFNPVADRLRILASTGASFRINVEDGKTTVDGSLKYAEADTLKGQMPLVVAGAYTHSIAGAKETALYDIDVTSGMLVKQAPPNDGILNTIGSLGIKITGPVSFDISTDATGMHSAWMMTGNALYSIDLATGAASMVTPITGLAGQTTDIAILPAT
jgi:DNA-binding beta-propeller fold protein YncE